MSRLIGNSRHDGTDFILGDTVSFTHEGHRLVGIVVRVYNSRTLYHIEVDGDRYEVAVPNDDPRKV